MSKVKSAIFLVFYTLLIAVLGFACLVSFPYGENGVKKFNSILSMTQKDSDLGGYYGSDGEYYLGGGYSGVYYPEGVLAGTEYENNLKGYEELVKSYEAQIEAETDAVKKAKLRNDLKDAQETLADYKNNYVEYGSLYLFKGDEDKEGVVDEAGKPTEEFKNAFAAAKEEVTARYAALRQDGVRVEVRDEFTLRIFVPQEMDSEQTALVYFGYTGPLTVKFGTGSDEAASTQIMPVRSTDKISDFVKEVKAASRNGSAYVQVKFTKEGLALIKDRTSAVTSESTGTVFFKVGDQTVISLTVSEPVSDDLYISSSAYTKEVATVMAALLNGAINGTENDIVFSLGDTYSVGATYGDSALTYLYIAFGVCLALMLVFFFVRYHLLGFVHLYTYLLFTIATILCVWSIGFLTLSVETFTAFLLMSAVLSVSDALTFEYARREYALGKTMSSSIKTGYKKSMWHLLDLHVVLALVGFIGFGIALAPLSSFFFVVGLLSVFSLVCSIAINRFTWATMMAFTKNKRAFCNFKVEESEDE